MPTFGPEVLFDAVVARFTADGTAAAHAFGWNKPSKHKITESRITWVPGDGGNAGELGAPKFPGGNPRRLGSFAELVTVQIAGFDASAPQDERAQYNATRVLCDLWFRALYLARPGTFRIVSSRWHVVNSELVHGAELHIVLAVDSVIFDAIKQTAPVDTGADITTSVEDLDEVTAIPAP